MTSGKQSLYLVRAAEAGGLLVNPLTAVMSLLDEIE